MEEKEDFCLRDYLILAGIIKAVEEGDRDKYGPNYTKKITEAKKNGAFRTVTIYHHETYSMRYEYEEGYGVLRGKSIHMYKDNNKETEFLITDLCKDEAGNLILIAIINGECKNVLRSNGPMNIYDFSPNFVCVPKREMVMQAEAAKKLEIKKP